MRETRTLDNRLDAIQEYLAEQLSLLKAIADSQSTAAEQQDFLQGAQAASESILKRVNVNVQAVVKTTDSILGITRRTEGMVRAIKQRDVRTLFSYTLDAWLCLYLYIVLHPLAPTLTQRIASVWQFVLLAFTLYRCEGPRLNGLIAFYTLSSYKAIYYLYWLNRGYVLGTLQHRPAERLQLSLKMPDCPTEFETRLVCAADYIVNCLMLTVGAVHKVTLNSELSLDLYTLWEIERGIWYNTLSQLLSLFFRWIYSLLPRFF